MQLAEIGPDDDLFAAWCEVLAAGERADRPDEPPRPASDHVALGRQLVAPGGSRDGTHRAAVVDGAVVGALRLMLPIKDNLTVAIVDLVVHPEHRRQGIGRQLLAEGERLASAHGRTELISEVDEPGPDTAGRAFALRHGWTCDLLETRRDLLLPPDEERLSALEAEAMRASAGYELVTWRDRTPDELLDDRALLEQRMTTDAPHGDLPVEEERWDGERIREYEASHVARGRTVLSAGAVTDGPAGRLHRAPGPARAAGAREPGRHARPARAPRAPARGADEGGGDPRNWSPRCPRYAGSPPTTTRTTRPWWPSTRRSASAPPGGSRRGRCASAGTSRDAVRRSASMLIQGLAGRYPLGVYLASGNGQGRQAMDTHHHDGPTGTADRAGLTRLAVSATLHCLTGCAIGEVLGMVIGTALGWSDAATIVLAVVLAFLFGYSLTIAPVLRSGLPLRAALGVAFAADTLSIAVMEIVDNAVMLLVPGAMGAGLTSLLFWGSLAFALVVAFVVTVPVNRWLHRPRQGARRRPPVPPLTDCGRRARSAACAFVAGETTRLAVDVPRQRWAR